MVPSDAVRILAALNSTQYFVRTLVSEFAELMVTFIYQTVMLCFIQIYLVFVCGNLARR